MKYFSCFVIGLLFGILYCCICFSVYFTDSNYSLLEKQYPEGKIVTHKVLGNGLVVGYESNRLVVKCKNSHTFNNLSYWETWELYTEEFNQ